MSFAYERGYNLAETLPPAPLRPETPVVHPQAIHQVPRHSRRLAGEHLQQAERIFSSTEESQQTARVDAPAQQNIPPTWQENRSGLESALSERQQEQERMTAKYQQITMLMMQEAERIKQLTQERDALAPKRMELPWAGQRIHQMNEDILRLHEGKKYYERELERLGGQLFSINQELESLEARQQEYVPHPDKFMPPRESRPPAPMEPTRESYHELQQSLNLVTLQLQEEASRSRALADTVHRLVVEQQALANAPQERGIFARMGRAMNTFMEERRLRRELERAFQALHGSGKTIDTLQHRERGIQHQLKQFETL